MAGRKKKKKVPEHGIDLSTATTLEDFGYYYNDKLELRQKSNGKCLDLPFCANVTPQRRQMSPSNGVARNTTTHWARLLRSIFK